MIRDPRGSANAITLLSKRRSIKRARTRVDYFGAVSFHKTHLPDAIFSSGMMHLHGLPAVEVKTLGQANQAGNATM